MTERQSSRRHYTKREFYTKEQLAYMESLIVDALRRRGRVNWKAHQHEIGHTMSSIQSMASILRERMRDKADRDRLRMIRNLMENLNGDPPPPARAVNDVPLPKLALDSERVTTSTQSLLFAAEMRNRIDPRNITAGLLGDPPPARSALDRKRAGIVDAPPQRYGRPESKWAL